MQQPMSVWALPGMPEVHDGDDLVAIIVSASAATGLALRDGDILVVTSKIVSKAEGRSRPAAERAQAIDSETVRVVAVRDQTRIVENRLGIVGAAAGVDASNVAAGTVLLLPEDPDQSARTIAAAIRATGPQVGVIISDTLGRPWREGQTDIAIGAAGVRVFDELIGEADSAGRPLAVTRPCWADELAGAADLITRKTRRLPVAVIRGLADAVGPLSLPGARSIVRPSQRDMFRLGSAEAYDAGFAAGAQSREHRSGDDDPGEDG